MPEVAIIGCGPSAMMIAHACAERGVSFFISAPKKPSFISGAQYLHSDVGLPTVRPSVVRYVRHGTAAGYEAKLYGTLPAGLETSWYKFPDEVQAWPLIQVYDILWHRHSNRIEDVAVTLDELVSMGDTYITFNTAPLPALKPDATYETEEVWITDHSHAPENTIVYNGVPGVPEYRSSNLFGHLSTEYPATVPSIPHYARRIKKPLRTDAFIPNVILSGRYGRWEKGVLVDESYHQAIKELEARGL